MFLASLEKSLKAIVLKPAIMFPMLIATLVSIFSMNLTSFVLEKPLSEMLFHLDVIMTSDLIAILISRYWIELIIMIVSGFIVFFVSIVAFISLSKFTKKENVVESINFAVSNVKKAISLTFFIFITSVSLFIIFQLFLFIIDIFYLILPEEINFFIALFVIPVIMGVIIVIFITKLGFTLPALIDNNIRNAIKKSWEFTDKKFWISFVYIIVILLIAIIILSAFTNIGIIFELSLLFSSIGEIISMTFIGLAISYYYFN